MPDAAAADTAWQRSGRNTIPRSHATPALLFTYAATSLPPQYRIINEYRPVHVTVAAIDAATLARGWRLRCLRQRR